MNGKRMVTDCSTGKTTLVKPDAEFLEQQVVDGEKDSARQIAEDAKIAHDKKISDEIRKIAEDSLVAKGELLPK